MEKLAVLIPIVFGLMLLVNIFTEVLKKILPDKVPTNLLVLILSFTVTIVSMFVYLEIANIAFVWWMLVVAIAMSFFVAYSAMFGFDKLKELLEQWKQFKE